MPGSGARRWRLAVAMALATAAVCPAARAQPADELAPRGATPGDPAVEQPGWPTPGVPWTGPAWSADPAARSWEGAPDADLRPSGLRLAGGAGLTGLAVDGESSVWVDGPWLVARVDPRTGSGQAWDAADDLAFGRVRQLVPSDGAGVWLVEEHRVRLFDGTRFPVDLEVPTEYRGGGALTAMAQRGPEVWVGSAAGVARWAGGAWAMVGLGDVSDVVALAVDREGVLWLSGRVGAAEGRRSGVARLVDGRWRVPEAGGSPRAVVEIVADPTGGVVVRSASVDPILQRFDGQRWVDLTPGLGRARVGALTDSALAVTAGGDLWAVGSAGVAVRPALGSWRPVASAARDGGESALVAPSAIAVVGGAVVVADRQGLVRVAGAGVERLWANPARRGVTGALAETLPAAVSLLGVSSTEAWVQPYGWYLSRTTRYAGGDWSAVGPPDDAWWNGVLAGVPTLGPDGRVWAISGAGLVSAPPSGGPWRVELAEVLPGRDWADPAPALVPGGRDALWVRRDDPAPAGPGWSLLQVRPGSRAAEVPGPPPALVTGDGGGRAIGPPTLAPARDGSLWVAQVASAGAGGRRLVVLSWDGTWRRVAELAGSFRSVDSAVATGDGALWVAMAAGTPDGVLLARLDGARWTTSPLAVSGLRAQGERACGLSPGVPRWEPSRAAASGPSSVVCVSPRAMAVQRLLDLPVTALDIAPDGTAWILGEQLARVPVVTGSAAPGS